MSTDKNKKTKKTASAQGKVVRPGLLGYSFYYSADHHAPNQPLPLKPEATSNRLINVKFTLFALATTILVLTFSGVLSSNNTAKPNIKSSAITKSDPVCGAVKISKVVIVSVNRRHMWACSGTKSVYDSPVITGMEKIPADLTPRGDYQISDKLTDQDLVGADSTGSWNDRVQYWLPFLHNQYGDYGFHDALWRNQADFGKVDPRSLSTDPDKQPSHGCVEMPLPAMKWLYDWGEVGTTARIIN